MNVRVLIPFILAAVVCVGLVIALLPHPSTQTVITYNVPTHKPSPTVVSITPTKSLTQSSPTPSVSTSDELPPLFPGLTIKNRQDEVMFQTEDPNGPSEVRGTVVEANILSEKDEKKIYEILVYYNKKISIYNYTNYLASDGPTGSLYGWKRNGKYFIFFINRDIQSGKTLSAFIRYN